MVIRSTLEDTDVLAFYETRILQSSKETFDLVAAWLDGTIVEHANDWHGLLRVCAQWENHHAGNQFDEITPPHSHFLWKTEELCWLGPALRTGSVSRIGSYG